MHVPILVYSLPQRSCTQSHLQSHCNVCNLVGCTKFVGSYSRRHTPQLFGTYTATEAQMQAACQLHLVHGSVSSCAQKFALRLDLFALAAACAWQHVTYLSPAAPASSLQCSGWGRSSCPAVASVCLLCASGTGQRAEPAMAPALGVLAAPTRFPFLTFIVSTPMLCAL